MVEETGIRFRIDARGAQRGAAQVRRSLGRIRTSAGRAFKALTSIRTALLTVGGALAIRGLIRVISTFEQLRFQLRSATGSAELAATAFEGIKEFTSATAFSVREVTQAFIKLRLFGIDPTREVLSDLGNLAAAFGGNLADLAGSVTRAITGEFERLESFGIQFRVVGEQLRLRFGETTKIINRDAKSIVEAIREIGRVRFAGALQDQLNTIKGSASLVGDQFDALIDKIGEAGLTAAIIKFNTTLAKSSIELEETAVIVGRAAGSIVNAAADIVSAVSKATNSLNAFFFAQRRAIITNPLFSTLPSSPFGPGRGPLAVLGPIPGPPGPPGSGGALGQPAGPTMAQLTGIKEGQQATQTFLVEVRAEAKKTETAFQSFGLSAVQSFSSVGDSISLLAVEGTINFKRLADAIISDLIRVAFQVLVVNRLISGLSSIIGGAATGDTTKTITTPSGFQMAEPPGGGSVRVRLQRGGIVRRPTFGLLGEAGPEAIIPLKDSGLGNNITNVFNINAIDAASFDDRFMESMIRNSRQVASATSNEFRNDFTMRQQANP